VRELEADKAQREKQQGLGKPIISADFHGQRIVAVGNRVYHSPKWKTFHDFLREYIFIVLGRDWVEEQQKKPVEDRHHIVRWFEQAIRDTRTMGVEKNGVFTNAMTGAQRAFLNLAYNLYLIAHHSDPEKAEEILDSFVWRLKSAQTDHFIGKLFETYASAAFLKAGFQLEYEDERDGSSSHVEFVATYPKTGKKFSVEVKSRNRQIGADGPSDNADHPNVWHKVKRALEKAADHERVIFVELNIPDVVEQDYTGTWVGAALQKMEEAEGYVSAEGKPYPPAYVFITNHAFHNNLEAADNGLQAITYGYRISDFGLGSQFIRFKDYLEHLESHREMSALFDSIKEHSHIPATFDGEIPEFMFGEDDEYPRLRIGYEYNVKNADGEPVPGVLKNAIVMEAWGHAQCFYRLRDGTSVMVSHELTEREWSAWKQHPLTFFGQLEEKQAKPQNWLELAEFFYHSHKNTSKDKLLEYMANHEDVEILVDLDQKELAIIYCERLGLSAWNDVPKSQEK
jgi:hypothetical protein